MDRSEAIKKELEEFIKLESLARNEQAKKATVPVKKMDFVSRLKKPITNSFAETGNKKSKDGYKTVIEKQDIIKSNRNTMISKHSSNIKTERKTLLYSNNSTV